MVEAMTGELTTTDCILAVRLQRRGCKINLAVRSLPLTRRAALLLRLDRLLPRLPLRSYSKKPLPPQSSPPRNPEIRYTLFLPGSPIPTSSLSSQDNKLPLSSSRHPPLPEKARLQRKWPRGGRALPILIQESARRSQTLMRRRERLQESSCRGTNSLPLSLSPRLYSSEPIVAAVVLVLL